MDASDPFLLPPAESKALREFPCGHPARKGEGIIVASKGCRSVEARRCRHCGSVWHLPRRTGKPLGWLSPDAGAMESLEAFPWRQARSEVFRRVMALFARGAVLAAFLAVAFAGAGTGAWLLDRPQPRAVVLPQTPTKTEVDAARARMAAGQVEWLRKAEMRVDDVSWRLAAAASGTCRKSRPRAGFIMSGLEENSAEPELAAICEVRRP